MKGFIAEIFKHAPFAGCANGGVSEDTDHVIIVEVDNVRIDRRDQIFDTEKTGYPAVKVVKRGFPDGVYIHIEPFEPCPEEMIGYSSGGTMIHTSDSRWKRIVGTPYAVNFHDRWDTPEQYERLSR